MNTTTPAQAPADQSAQSKAERCQKHIDAARMELLIEALFGFVEEVLGRVPTDAELGGIGYHAQFSDSPLAVYECEGKRFTNFYVFDGEALAHGFLNPAGQFDLSVVRVPKDKWPLALRLFAEKHDREVRS